ncbi:DMT family transporter [Rubrobacter marinus]|uniref:DMT family transporter n=1 Tax=Rubrobacter marinus TaxID=2653852 RepID=UPI00140869EF|nr:DMT family transporter [Rubrobacter marinus]
MFADRRLVVLAFVALVVLWGSSFSALKVGLEYAPPVLFAGARSILGGLLVTLVALVWGGSPKLRRDWPVFALLSALNVVLFLGLQTVAIMYLPSGSAAVLIYLQPILVGVLAWMFLGEGLTTRKVVGLLLGFSGIAAVSAGGLLGELPPGASLGVALGVGAALSWALGTVYFKKAQERVALLWAVAVPFLAGGVVLTALGALVESPSEITWNAPFVASLLYASLLGTGVAWLLWLGLVRAGEASRVSAYIFFVPLVAVLIGAVFLDETLSPSLVAGAALVVAGIYLANGPQPEQGAGKGA